MNTLICRLDTIMGNVESSFQEFGFGEQLGVIKEERSFFEKRPITLLVSGEFKRGKSSFINVFLGEDICEEGTGITTASISLIRYGKTRRVVRHFGNILNNDVALVTEEIPFSDIARYSKGRQEDIGDTVLLEIELPNKRLEEGLVLIDTPGVGSLDPRHKLLTLYALHRADAVLFLTDTGEEVMASEADFYKVNIAQLDCPKRVLINKSDSASPEEIGQLEEDTKNKLCLTSKVPITSFSALLWKEYNKCPADNTLRLESHVDEVEKTISSLRNEFWNQYAERLRDKFSALLERLINAVSDSITSLQDNGDIDGRIAELQSKLSTISSLKQEYTDVSSGKRTKINELIKDSQDKIISEFQKESILLSTERLKELVDSYSRSKDGEDYVIKEMNKAITNLHSSIDCKVSASFEDITKVVGLELNDISIDYDDYSVKKSNSTSSKPVSERILNSVQSSWLPATIGATLLMNPTTWPLGFVIGIGGVTAAIRRSKAAERTTAMMNHIQPHVTIAMSELRLYIQKRYEAFSKDLLTQLNTRLESMNSEAKCIMSLLQGCSADQRSRNEKITSLQQKTKFLKEQLLQTNVVGSNPLSIG